MCGLLNSHWLKLEAKTSFISVVQLVLPDNGTQTSTMCCVCVFLLVSLQADVTAFCSHLPLMEVSVTASVAGEKEIVEGDIVTVTVELTRTNLKEHEVAGPVHAPYFPKVKYEEWWIFLREKSTGESKQLRIWRVDHHVYVCVFIACFSCRFSCNVRTEQESRASVHRDPPVLRQASRKAIVPPSCTLRLVCWIGCLD